MEERFSIRYPASDAGRKLWAKRFGANAYYAGKHWAQRREDAEFWHGLVRAEMNRQNVRETPFRKPVAITFYFNDRLDCSNHCIMVKLIEDAMKGRLITDDNRRYVKGISICFHDEDCILIEVREIESERMRANGKKR